MEKKGPDHYRYYAALSEEDVHVKCERFIVIGETERCYYVISENSEHLVGKEADWAQSLVKKRRRRVLKNSHRRYCYPDKMEALQSFAARQRWRISHAQRSTSMAQLSLKVVKRQIELGMTDAPMYCGHDDYTASLNWGDC
ncbi:hypothetical protein D3C81_1180710 [compost metagenome]